MFDPRLLATKLEERAAPTDACAQHTPIDPHAILLERVTLIERSLMQANNPDDKAKLLPQLQGLRERIKQMSGQYDKRFEEVRQRNARALDTLSGLSEKLAQIHEGYGRVGGVESATPTTCGLHDRPSRASTACSTAESSRCSSRDATPAARCRMVERTPPRRAQVCPPGSPALAERDAAKDPRLCEDAAPLSPAPPVEVQDTPSPPWPLWPEFEARVLGELEAKAQVAGQSSSPCARSSRTRSRDGRRVLGGARRMCF